MTAAMMLRAIYGDTPVPLIRDFQDKSGLYATGELDAATMRELEQAMVWKRYGGPAPLPRKKRHRR